MADDFDPDAYLGSDFDPDAYLEPPSISAADAAKRGAAEGLTLGQSERLGAMQQSALDRLLGGISPVDKKLVEQGFTGDLTPSPEAVYEKALQEEYAATRQARENQPGAFESARFAGSLPILGLAPQVGAAGTAARTAGLVGEAALTSAVDASGEEGATPKDIAKAGLAGAAVVPAVVGAMKLAGATTSAIGAGATKIKQGLSELSYPKGLIESYERGVKGQTLLGESARTRTGEALADVSQESLEQIGTLQNKVGAEMQRLREEADKAGVKINIEKLYADAYEKVLGYAPRTKLQTRETETLKEFLEAPLKKGDKALKLSPSEAAKEQAAAKELTELGEESIKTRDLKSVPLDISRSIGESVKESVPGYREAARRYHVLGTAEEIAGVSKGTLTQADKAKKVEVAARLISKIAEDTKSSDAAKRKIASVLSLVGEVDPQLSKELSAKWTDVASAYDLAHEMAKKGSLIGNLIGTTRGLHYSAANISGLAMHRLSNATPVQLKTIYGNITQRFGQSGDELNRVLNEALMSDNRKRNAILFAIGQNPDYRKMIKDASDSVLGEESDEQQ